MLSQADQLLREFLDGPPVCALVGTEFTKQAAVQAPLYQRVAQWYQKNGCATVDTPNIGPVLLDERAVTRSIHHGLTHIKGVGFAAVPAVLYYGRIIHEEPLLGSDEGRVYYVAAPIIIAAEGYLVVVMVKKDQIAKGRYGARMYLHSVISKQKLRQSAYPSGVGIAPEGKTHDTHSAEAGAVWKLLMRIYKVKSTRP